MLDLVCDVGAFLLTVVCTPMLLNCSKHKILNFVGCKVLAAACGAVDRLLARSSVNMLNNSEVGPLVWVTVLKWYILLL